MSVLGTIVKADSVSFFTETGNHRKRAYARLITSSSLSHHDGSPETLFASIQWLLYSNYPYLSGYGQRNLQYWNINQFPFRQFQLRIALGSTNPWLTNIAKEPLPLRRYGFSPYFAATLTRILVGTRSTGLHSPASAHAPRPLTKSHYCVLKYR